MYMQKHLNNDEPLSYVQLVGLMPSSALWENAS